MSAIRMSMPILGINGAWLRAQVADPILTKSAVVRAPNSGVIKLEYAGGLGPSGGLTHLVREPHSKRGGFGVNLTGRKDDRDGTSNLPQGSG
jgi:hypothetical protein